MIGNPTTAESHRRPEERGDKRTGEDDNGRGKRREDRRRARGSRCEEEKGTQGEGTKDLERRLWAKSVDVS